MPLCELRTRDTAYVPMKAVWQVLCPRWREDAARTAARVDRAVNLLLQTEPAGTPLLTSLQASALSALRAAVADPRGWRAMPAVLTAAPLTEAVLRDLCMVYGHELRALLLQTVCAPEDSTGEAYHAMRRHAMYKTVYYYNVIRGSG